ncbi:MAG: TetR/AcrR family transcriptional regulator [Actinobacteria bacterium]|nr:TetR/AcrR family transcriptional regulator [Actinomycetota bacterium]
MARPVNSQHGDARTRILQATYDCVARYGLAKTTLDDAARQAGLSRATVYRHFPGGRDQLIKEVISWETMRFFERLYEVVLEASGLDEMVALGLMFAHRALKSHDVLQKILETEPELLLPQLTVEADRVTALIAAFLQPHLERYLATGRSGPCGCLQAPTGLPSRGVDTSQAADYLARMALSFIASPGRWDLTDPDQVAHLVRTELLAGLTGA